MVLDNKDKELLNLLQDKFPLCDRPFMVLGNQLNLSEEEVITRVKALKENGYIRRLSGTFNSNRLGYASTLCAIPVPEDRIEEVSKIINSYRGVTHNYIRNHRYNMWFTLIAPSTEKITEILEDIKNKTGIHELLNLPAIKIFKIKTNFDMKGMKRIAQRVG